MKEEKSEQTKRTIPTVGTGRGGGSTMAGEFRECTEFHSIRLHRVRKLKKSRVKEERYTVRAFYDLKR